MAENKVLGFLKDNLGDNSSKRLTAFILLGCAVFIGLFSAIFALFAPIPAPSLILSIFGGFLGGALVSQGLTVPELFSNLTKKQG